MHMESSFLASLPVDASSHALQSGLYPKLYILVTSWFFFPVGHFGESIQDRLRSFRTSCSMQMPVFRATPAKSKAKQRKSFSHCSPGTRCSFSLKLCAAPLAVLAAASPTALAAEPITRPSCSRRTALICPWTQKITTPRSKGAKGPNHPPNNWSRMFPSISSGSTKGR